MTFPVSFDSPSLRVPNENGISVMPSLGIGALRSKSNAILNPWGLRPEAWLNCVRCAHFRGYKFLVDAEETGHGI
jgi:hypothetical protein